MMTYCGISIKQGTHARQCRSECFRNVFATLCLVCSHHLVPLYVLSPSRVWSSSLLAHPLHPRLRFQPLLTSTTTPSVLSFTPPPREGRRWITLSSPQQRRPLSPRSSAPWPIAASAKGLTGVSTLPPRSRFYTRTEERCCSTICARRCLQTARRVRRGER